MTIQQQFDREIDDQLAADAMGFTADPQAQRGRVCEAALCSVTGAGVRALSALGALVLS